jgi:hypothetical protein
MAFHLVHLAGPQALAPGAPVVWEAPRKGIETREIVSLHTTEFSI